MPDLLRPGAAILLAVSAFAAETRTPFFEAMVRRFFRRHPDAGHIVVISKSAFRLQVVDRGLRVLADVPVGIGRNPDLKPKLHASDNRTPEGFYRVTQAIHKDLPPESEGYRLLRRMNAVRFLAKDGYTRWNDPKADLGTNAYGYGFFRIDYPNPQDRRRYREALARGEIPLRSGGTNGFVGVGTGIAIHGTNDPDSVGHPSSTGCIRVRNEDLRAIAPYLAEGTHVFIGP